MTIRVASPADTGAITAIYAPIVVGTSISFELTPPSVDETRERIVNTLHELPWLVSADARGEVDGYVYAGTALPNDASVALHESVGFQPNGIYRNVGFKLGAWHDVGWWQKELRSPTEPADATAFRRHAVP